MADIGLSGIWSANRTSDDQPVASAIGISGTIASDSRRRSASSTRNTAARPASSVAKRRQSDASLPFASAASTGSPARSAVTPGGGFRSLLRMSSITACWRSSGRKRMPNAIVAVRRSGVITACEKYGGTAASSAFTVCAAFGVWRNRSVSESAGHSSGGFTFFRQVSPVLKPCAWSTRPCRSVIQLIAAGVVTAPCTVTSISPDTPVAFSSSFTSRSAGRSCGTSWRTSDSTAVCVSATQPITASAQRYRQHLPRLRDRVRERPAPAPARRRGELRPAAGDQREKHGEDHEHGRRHGPHDHGVHAGGHAEHDHAQARQRGRPRRASRAGRRRAAHATAPHARAPAASAAVGQPASPAARRSAPAWRGPP